MIKRRQGLHISTGVKAGQRSDRHETRYGVIEQVPGSKRGLWLIDDTAYFGIDSTTYDQSNGLLQPGACVEMLYDAQYGNVLSMSTVDMGVCQRATLRRPGGSYEVRPQVRFEAK
jgi:hypothetical protein